jgi:hypothetical protein
MKIKSPLWVVVLAVLVTFGVLGAIWDSGVGRSAEASLGS